MNGIQGLTRLDGVQVAYDDRPEATPEERLGNPADPRHGNWGEQAHPLPSQSSLGMAGSHGPYGPENQLLGDPSWVIQPAGDETQDPYMDTTPSRRAAPWPKGVASGPVPSEGPEHISAQLSQSYGIHGINKGASRKMVTSQAGDVQQDDWIELWEVNPGNADQTNLPAQYKSAGFMFGTWDRIQSFARQNGYGFDSKHMHRRYADASGLPGNFLWMQPRERPMVKHIPRTAPLPVGPSSPFVGDDGSFDFNPKGALLQNQPTEYVAPSQPYLAPVPTLDTSEGSVPDEVWF